MQVKIDTKDKFHVITPMVARLSATMTDELQNTLRQQSQQQVKNVILNLQHVAGIDDVALENLVNWHQDYYTSEKSFIICCMQKNVAGFLATNDMADVLNITPTESEAWDMVHMEEIERELLGGEE